MVGTQTLNTNEQRLNFFRAIFGRPGDDRYERPQLHFKEFMIIATVYNMNLNYMTTFLELVIYNGAIPVCVFYLILTALLGMPLSMLFIFLSSYSKKSYLAIWDCAPLLEGIGYSMATIRFTSECYNVMIAATAIMIIVDVLMGDLKNSLAGCKFDDALPNTHICLPMTNKNFTVECTRNNKTFTSIQYYYSFVVRRCSRDTDWETPRVNGTLLCYIAFVWLLVFFLSTVGFKRLKKITVNLQIFFTCVMAILVTTILAQIEFKRHKFRYLATPEVSIKFWVEIILHAAETTILGNLIWLGSMKPDCLDPKYAVIITSPIKLLLLLLIVCTTTVSTQESMVAYDIVDKKCFDPTGSEVLMAVIPDVLFRFDIWQIPTGLWYLSIFFFATLASLYSIIGLVDSITEKFNSLKKYTLIVCFTLCVLGFLLSIWLTLNVSFLIIKDWRHGGLTVLTATMSLLINLAIFFVYSTRKVIEDYIFTYGKAPEKYWVALWKAAPIFTIFAFIFALSFQSSAELTTEHNIWVISLSYLQCSTVLLPVVTIMIGRCCKNIKHRTLDYLTKPAPSWGPTNPARKLARANFFPQRDIKCRNLTLKCKHKCAVSNNLKYMEEIAYQRKKFLLAQQEMEREILAGNYVEDD